MSKKYVQLRCNMMDPDSEKVSSENLTIESLLDGVSSDLGNNVLAIALNNVSDISNYSFTKISIRTIPGMKFSLNENGIIIIGSSGYYEIDNSNGNFSLNSLEFAVESIENFIGTYTTDAGAVRKNGYILMEIEYAERSNS